MWKIPVSYYGIVFKCLLKFCLHKLAFQTHHVPHEKRVLPPRQQSRDKEGFRTWERGLWNSNFSPGWCGSVDWVTAREPKGLWFNSQSGHMPGLRARSPVRSTQEGTTHWCFSPSLSPSLPLCLKNKLKEYFLKMAKSRTLKTPNADRDVEQ